MQWDVEPVANQMAQMAEDLTARINALDPESDTPVYSDFNFSIAVGDWTLANGVYTARINNTVLLTENSGIQVFYDASLRNYLVGDIFVDKHTGYVDFTTTQEPSGVISGIIRVLDSVSGMLSVAKGGTGASTPKKARENLDVPIRDILVNFGTVSSLPQTIYDADITANMVAFDAVFSNPAAVPDGIDVTFADGSVTISGTITSGQDTTIKFWAHEQRTSVEGTEASPAEPRINEFLHVGAQTLTSAEQTQIRTNLGAASASDVSALNSKIAVNTDSGTFGSQSALDSLLNNVLNGMESDGRKSIKVVCNSGFDIFPNGATFDCVINKFGSNASYGTIFMQQVGSSKTIVGNKNNGTWSYEQLALNSNLANLSKVGNWFFRIHFRGAESFDEFTIKNISEVGAGFIISTGGLFTFHGTISSLVSDSEGLTIENRGNDVYRFSFSGAWYRPVMLITSWNSAP